MSFNYEKVEDNIYTYKTKTGKVRYRVKITIEYVAFDKSGFKNITAARAFIRQSTADVLNGEHSKNKPTEYTFGEYWEYYSERKSTPRGTDGKADWNKTTISTSQTMFNNHILPVFKDVKLKSITRIQLENFADDLINNKNLRTASAQSILTRISSMLEHAVENEVLDRNRCYKLTPPTSELGKINKELPLDHFEKLSTYYSNRHIGLKVRFSLLSLGLRSSEMTGLRVKSIEFIPNYVTPKAAKITIDKSRPRQYTKEGKSTKTGTSRVVYAPERIASELKEYLDWMKNTYKQRDKVLHSDDWLLINLKTLTPVKDGTIYAELRASGERLGITISPHMLRHHFATRAKLDGIDIRYIADVLGHKSLATTDGYTHGSDESAKIISEKVTFL